jgi:hypothetical protein
MLKTYVPLHKCLVLDVRFVFLVVGEAHICRFCPNLDCASVSGAAQAKKIVYLESQFKWIDVDKPLVLGTFHFSHKQRESFAIPDGLPAEATQIAIIPFLRRGN